MFIQILDLFFVGIWPWFLTSGDPNDRSVWQWQNSSGRKSWPLLVAVDVIPRGGRICNGHSPAEHCGGGGGCKVMELSPHWDCLLSLGWKMIKCVALWLKTGKTYFQEKFTLIPSPWRTLPRLGSTESQMIKDVISEVDFNPQCCIKPIYLDNVWFRERIYVGWSPGTWEITEKWGTVTSHLSVRPVLAQQGISAWPRGMWGICGVQS